MAVHDPDDIRQTDPEDAVNPELTVDVDSEDMDEDRLGVDPLEEGMEPPERPAAVDRYGVTAREQREREGIDERLPQEQADVTPESPAEPQESVDTSGMRPEEYSLDALGETRDVHAEAEGGRQFADEGGGSVAEGIRTPPESPVPTRDLDEAGADEPGAGGAR